MPERAVTHTRKLAAQALFVALLLVLLGGCSERSVDAGLVLQRGLPADPESLDQHKARSIQAADVLRDIGEGLVGYSPTGLLMPAAAERWEVSADGLTYTFHLREQARWSNGDKVTAGHFVFGLRRLVAPATGAFYANLLAAVVNAPEIVAGELPVDALGAEAPDDLTLVLKLARPTPYLLSLLAHPSTFPLHPASVAKFGERFARPGKLLSNGAFVLQAWVPGSLLALRRNEYYWNNAATALDGVNYHVVIQDSAELNRYRAGELHVTSTVPPDNFAGLRAQYGSELHVAPYLGLYYYGFNLLREPFKSNATLRKALSMAVDREMLAEKVLGRGEAPAYSFVPPGVDNYLPTVFSFTPLTKHERETLARRLYKEAGYGEAKPLKIELRYNTSDTNKKIAVSIQSMWRDVLGVETTLINEEFQVLLANMRDAEVTQVFRSSWIGDYNDAHTFLSTLQAGTATNMPRYASADYESLMKRAAEQVDLGRRRLYLEEAERVMLADHPVIPLYFYVSRHLVSPKVGGWGDNVLDYHYSQHLSLSATD
ncbi:MAG: peptide ABC transporter substrate-binding protein [Gammaproteobacteria bacterium]|nr:peptide ABC transporter substrate-binding protein [Gammaproteobacteria bacterium]MBT8110725.1 peptide ABC transporter substrate-binding protein [Gammaproteobacteria bacterium]NNL45424.1 peptide ABC transporter substrate-binding protein [Woeseiaceae bacterium]